MASGPLDGVKVVDLSTVVLGPLATLMLGDMGADVLKIENKAGDIMRRAGGSPAKLMGPIFMQLNRNKRSIVLDLKSELGKEALTRALAEADVFFSNVRLEGLARLGFDYEGVRKINPSIVMVHVAGFGPGGEYAGRQAYDDLVQAASGVADLIARRDGGDPSYFPSLVADKATGLYAVSAVLGGLFHKEKTGEGQFVSVPMLESFTSFNMVENLYGHTFNPPTGKTVYTRSANPNRKPYKTKDGFISIVPYSDEQWSLFFELGGRPGIMEEDPRFATYEERTKNIGQLYAIIHEVTSSKTTEEWLEICDKANIPAMRFNKMEDVQNDPHLKGSGFFQYREHKDVGEYLSMKCPIEFSKTPADIRQEPPMLGEHNEEVLKELGFSDEEIESAG